MAALTVGSKIGPTGGIGNALGIETFFLAAHVASVTSPVPDLHKHPFALFRVHDLKVVKPLLSQNVPAWWKHYDAAVGKRGEIVLNAPASERIIDPMFLLLSGKIRLGDVVGALLPPQPISQTAQLDLANGKIAFNTEGSRGLQHLAMPRMGPFLIFGRVTVRTRCRPYVGCLPGQAAAAECRQRR